MKAEDLCIFLTVYALCACFAAVRAWVQHRTALGLIVAAAATAAVFASAIIGYHVDTDRGFLGLVWFLWSQRDFSAAVSAGFGLAAAATWLLPWPGTSRPASDEALPPRRTQVASYTILVASLVGVFSCALLFIWKDLYGIQLDPTSRVHAPEFMIEKVVDLEFLPIRIAVSESDQIFVAYSYFEDWGDMGGAIVEILPDSPDPAGRARIVADSPLLLRSYGLAARGGDLYVSRTGLASHADKGLVSYDATGAITRLQDLNGDGYFEYADDTVTGLPGSRGPDTMHQNNAIAFAADGSLFVTIGSADDRTLADHPWSGTILRCGPDDSQVEVFAEGFRNPFGMVIGPEGELFVTDNDVDESPGDELNHVQQGAHYGHPYVVPQEPQVAASGFREPILLGDHESNFLGMAYATSPELPSEYRNCIYMVDYMQNRIVRLRLERAGETFRVVDVKPFATVSSPVDIAVTSTGEFYCLSRRTQNVYRIRLKQQTTAK